MKTFKQFLKEKGISEDDFAQKSAEEMGKLFSEYQETELKAMNEKIQEAAQKSDIPNVEEAIKAFFGDDMDPKDIKKKLDEIDEKVSKVQDGLTRPSGGSMKAQINKFIEDNHAEIKKLYSQKSGIVELTVKAPETVTTGNATNPDDIPEIAGVQQAPPSFASIRNSDIWNLTTNVNTSLSAYPYTETVPKDGDFGFVAEGAVKPQIDFKIETRYANPSKVAAWIKLTEESVQDIPNLQSIANDLLFKKHNRKRQKAILNGDGISPNPKGAYEYGRTFVAGDMATAVANPNIMDVINAAAVDIFTTHNYEDEENYMASLVMLNPVDFFLNFTSAKDGDGKPLYPTATLFNVVVIGGMVIRPDEDIDSGKIFIADMSKYNTTNYMPYTVKIGMINDDFIKNQFVILGESRFHAFVRKLDEQAFLYDDIATIKTAITAA